MFHCRSAGKVYHVLIFHKGGQYSLDIAAEEEGTQSLFNSLDDLVVFCMSHQLKMEGDEVRHTLLLVLLFLGSACCLHSLLMNEMVMLHIFR